MEATHHGPEINSPTMFVEIGKIFITACVTFNDRLILLFLIAIAVALFSLGFETCISAFY